MIVSSILLFIAIAAIISHFLAIYSGVLVIRKFEDSMKDVCHKQILNIRNLTSQRIWLVMVSICVSVGYLLFGLNWLTFFLKTPSASDLLYSLKYILMNLSVGVLIAQFNFLTLSQKGETQ